MKFVREDMYSHFVDTATWCRHNLYLDSSKSRPTNKKALVLGSLLRLISGIPDSAESFVLGHVKLELTNIEMWAGLRLSFTAISYTSMRA